MRTIHVVLITAVVLAATLTIRAQGEQPALVGLPEYGVTLSGNPEDLVIVNHSARAIIAYLLNTVDQRGLRSSYHIILMLSMQPAEIPDGGSLYAIEATPVNSTVPKASQAPLLTPGEAPIVKAVLQNVIFADGQFVGENEYGTFEEFSKRIKAIVEVGTLARTQAWDQVESLARNHQLAAQRLVETRRLKGEAAAGQLAEIYSSLPTLRK
jgi:hypothetical protein